MLDQILHTLPVHKKYQKSKVADQNVDVAARVAIKAQTHCNWTEYPSFFRNQTLLH
jgi:hypothetical protein